MSRKPLPADLYLLSKISKLYFEQGLTQMEIAHKLNLSRPKVSRLLQQAQYEGVVQITVHSPPGAFPDLEQELEKHFNLREVLVIKVVEPETQEAVSNALGVAATNYFQRTIEDGDIIGISWGTTLGAMVNALVPLQVRDVHVVQMIGGLGYPEAEVHATSLCRRLTQLLNSKLTLMPAPGIVDSQEVKQVLLSDSHVQMVFELFSKINVAYVGIGAPTPDSVVMRGGGILNHTDVEELRSKGAVGDIALRFFDIHGLPVHSDIEDRVIGITLEQLKQIPHVVGIAGGAQKHTVIRGALEGGLIDALITDDHTASCLLDQPFAIE